MVGQCPYPVDELAHGGGTGWRWIREAKGLLALGPANLPLDRALRKAVTEVDLGVSLRVLRVGGAELREVAGCARLKDRTALRLRRQGKQEGTQGGGGGG